MRLPIIKRGGVASKARACHWCKARRFTGYWLKPKGYARFHPSCSAGMYQHLRATGDDMPMTALLNSSHVQLRDHEDEDTIAIRRRGDFARSLARRAGRFI